MEQKMETVMDPEQEYAKGSPPLVPIRKGFAIIQEPAQKSKDHSFMCN